MEGTWASTEYPGKIHVVNTWLFISIWGKEIPWHVPDLAQVLTWASFTQVLYLSKTSLQISAATRSNSVPDPQDISTEIKFLHLFNKTLFLFLYLPALTVLKDTQGREDALWC